MNLLTDEWIPVKLNNEFKRISLETLLCNDKEWEISCFRDDMELATIQLLVCIVQVCFMPKDKNELKQRIDCPLNSEEYEKGIATYLEWFDLFHEKWPFMQRSDVFPNKKNNNFTSLHKLFVGLPEKSSSSPSSNAHWNRTDEIETSTPGDTAIALFQQSTNGFSLGGAPFSVGLKGSMPLTTLIIGKTLRHTIWVNILSENFINERAFFIPKGLINEPTWVTFPVNRNEHAHKISLLRGLFCQPSKIKLKHDFKNIFGFYTQPGPCTIIDYWYHPHTPVDNVRLSNNNPNEKPFFSLRGSEPLWSQMLGFFYSQTDYGQGIGTSCALNVQQYKNYRLGKRMKLAMGGYIKGGSTESLAYRKHEIFDLSEGWEERYSEMKLLIDIGREYQKILNSAIFICCKNTFGTGSNFEKELKQVAKNSYYRDSEAMFHSYLRETEWGDPDKLKKQLTKLVRKTYEETILSLNSDLKYMRGIIEGRKFLNFKIKDI